MNDIIVKMGPAALGTRLRRLSERLDRDVREIYAAQDFPFEPSWFPVITALADHGALSVGELAAMTGVSQPAISQIRKRVEDQGYVRARVAATDHRRHELTLTESGKRLVAVLTPLWAAIADASGGLCTAVAPNLLAELEAVERALDASSMSERVTGVVNRSAQIKSVKKRRTAS